MSLAAVPGSRHNISAYQFTTASGTRHADNDDDGETAAGSRLAHLLTLLVSDKVAACFFECDATSC